MLSESKKYDTSGYRCEQGTFMLEYAQRRGTYNMAANHMHDSYEVYFLLSGQRKYFIKDRLYAIEKGDIVFIPKYDLHRTLDAGSNHHERLLLHFNEEFLIGFAGEEKTNWKMLLRPFDTRIFTLRLNKEDRHHVEAMLYRAIKEMKERQHGYELSVKALTIELLVYLSRCADRYQETVLPLDTPIHRKIAEIANYIEENHAEPLKLSHLAERFQISKYYLCRAFREVSGFSFVEFLNHVRIKEAKRLLRETDLTILHISGQVGFESIAHFGRVFKQTVHLTPVQYRRMQRLEKGQGE